MVHEFLPTPANFGQDSSYDVPVPPWEGKTRDAAAARREDRFRVEVIQRQNQLMIAFGIALTALGDRVLAHGTRDDRIGLALAVFF